jgi:itaconate CoA-transferase
MAEHVLLEASLGTDDRFATNAQRIANVDELESLLGARLAGMAADEARQRLARGRIVTARVNDLQGLWSHEQLRERGRFVDVDTPGGTVEMLASPFDISGWTPPPASVPALDQHDDAVLAEIRRRGELPR